ncbi:hypothetical protein CCACVL1_25654 [Corchorus capsularis]|uniref:Uncharacterized protein n=1 Tax=Corchorus capsularis TaxID=210143 RepID=A0A1R3GIL2_COCAP|nr:hypothetical protein CCACVL1_25654 [Corchorus capsularis]
MGLVHTKRVDKSPVRRIVAAWDNIRQKMKNMGSSGRLSMEELSSAEDNEEVSRMAISTFQAKEEEIERKKMQVKEKVELQLGRAEEETRRLSMIWEELEVLSDPLRKEVAMVRKKIDMANRELKPLGQSCQKKMLTESERLRMKKLEELSKNIESME